MTTTIKLKSVLQSFFQTQNSMILQKTIKPLDKFSNNSGDESSTHSICNETEASNCSTSTNGTLDEYRIKREKNNESVRKSRAKNRVKLQECASRVQELQAENIELKNKLNNLLNELFTLRSLYKYCFSFNSQRMTFNPSNIPTSELYNLIMENKIKFLPTNIDKQSTFSQFKK